MVEVQHYTGGPWIAGTPRSGQQIDAYRANYNSAYGSIAHTTQGSPLAGFYNIDKGIVKFTGFAARIYVPTISRATVTTLIPDEYEGAWVFISAGILLKEGDNMLPIGQHYAQLGTAALQAIAQEGTIPPLVDYKEA